MSETTSPKQLQQYLIDLQVESLRVIAQFTGIIGYFVLLALLSPAFHLVQPRVAWAGGLVLAAGSTAGYFLPDRYYTLASHAIVWGALVAALCAAQIMRAPEALYLFIVPVIFASVLLTRRTALASAFVVLGCIVFVGSEVGVDGLLSRAMVLPILIAGLVTFAAWLSAQRLYLALAWFGDAYERAHANEQEARNRQAELQRILKALDEANYRIERANYMLAVAWDQAEEARRLKQHFVQNVSHELRTPLNLIIGFTELMAKSPEYYGNPLPPAYLRDLTVVYRNACHLQTLVNDVLDLSRLEAAQMSLQSEVVDAELLVQEAANTIRSMVETRGLDLKLQLEHDLPLLWGDPTRLRQVLFNLLSNAVRFTERGFIRLSVEREAAEIIFGVADTGVGISPGELEHVFEEFRQVDGTTRRKHGGTGLGLAISRQFVKLHGGRIWAESEPGVGSTFWFSIPLAAELQTSTLRRPATHLAHVYQPPAGQGVLLCISQSPAGVTFLANHLSRYRILVANTLDQGQTLARNVMPQAVLVDASHQDVTRAKLREIAQAWQLPNVPFIAARLPTAGKLRPLDLVDGYLVKPVQRQNLWDMLRQLGHHVETILIIDDDRDFVRLLRSMLNSVVRRYQISSAYSGYEGLAMMRTRRPDLILLDLMLPGLGGFQVIEQIRSEPEWQKIPIVVISAQDEIDQAQLLDGPVLLTKEKGMSPGELVGWIEHALKNTSSCNGQATHQRWESQ